ncbi:aminodeoxychorismate synthase component I [Prosthecodimorpha staleyi]|uniref:aminodeoxychorismate synthase n=1 Tax=Prosthecodimorpha staleyi TaxID=2840188 RepID=A0A947D7Q7_9HYPH|nr:aminodeoxychorismate synthase component I [Prosthecodimorpha staleyi]MBT9291923.1 aminodeoxychorismate synthase component I [Prosthecodimorpha staleyi]
MRILDIGLTDPIAAALSLAGLPGLCVLESAMRDPALGRFSSVAADPFGVFTVVGGTAFWNGAALEGDPLEALGARLALYPQGTVPGPGPFQGGAAGYLGYELGRALESLPEPAVPEPSIPDMRLGFYDVVVSFDHVTGRTAIVSTGWPEQDPEARAARAEARAADFAARLARPGAPPEGPGTATLAWMSNFTRADYETAVARVVEWIRAGDIFQANLAQRFAARLPEDFDPLAFYLRLRHVNPATFAAYLDCDGFAVASSSPERFVRLADGEVEARPIKGTAKRSPDAHEDAAHAAELMASAKDRAENVMIVDLLRNDLSRVCRAESVEVPALCGLESYASVHHLVSVVTGRLEPGLGAVDLIRASFPGGSITGAPKIRAMEIITELERHARGVYCGAIGWLGFDGAMDLNIAIRTVTFRGGEAVFHAGGGVTLLSDPAAEYEETLVKAARIFAAFRPDRNAPA